MYLCLLIIVVKLLDGVAVYTFRYITHVVYCFVRRTKLRQEKMRKRKMKCGEEIINGNWTVWQLAYVSV